MYKALYDYACKNNLKKIPNRTMMWLGAYILINEEGEYKNIEFVDAKAGKKSVPSRTKNGQGVALWGDEKSVIFYHVMESEGKYEKKSLEWRKLLEEASKELNEIKIVKKFVDKIDSDIELASKISNDLGALKKSVVSFKIVSDDIYSNVKTILDESESVAEYCDRKNAERLEKSKKTNTAISIISGSEQEIIGNRFPTVSSLRAPLASFKHEVFESYGLEENLNTPMSEVEADAIVGAIESLLKSESNHISMFNILYWYDDKSVSDILSNILSTTEVDDDFEEEVEEKREHDFRKNIKIKGKSIEKDYLSLNNSVFKSEKIKNYKNVKLHMMYYYATAMGRMRLLNYICVDYEKLYNAIIKWNRDTALCRPIYIKDENEKNIVQYYEYGINSIYPFLFMFIDGEPDNIFDAIKKQYGTNLNEFAEAVIKEKQIPLYFYKHALIFIDKYMLYSNKSNEANSKRKYTQKRYYNALALIKAYLLRKGGKENKMSEKLNENLDNIAYQCGRWFATLAFLQRESTDKNINADIASKYYRMAKQAPGTVFARINNLKEVYLKRLDNVERKHRKVSTYNSIFAEIGEKIGMNYPKTFTVYEQGAFDLGYAHQMNSFFQKKVEEDNNTKREKTEGE